MYFFSHIYVAKKIAKKHDSELYLGAMLPDYSITGLFPLKKTHNKDFHDFVLKEFPERKQLALGVRLHSDDFGLDYFAHHKYNGKTGWTFQKAEKLKDYIKKITKADDKTAVKIGHLYIETAVDFLLPLEHPELVDNLLEALGMKKLAIEVILRRFSINKYKIWLYVSALNSLCNPRKKQTISKFATISSITSRKVYGYRIPKKDSERLMLKAVNLIKDNYIDFLNDCARQMKKKINLRLYEN